MAPRVKEILDRMPSDDYSDAGNAICAALLALDARLKAVEATQSGMVTMPAHISDFGSRLQAVEKATLPQPCDPDEVEGGRAIKYAADELAELRSV